MDHPRAGAAAARAPGELEPGQDRAGRARSRRRSTGGRRSGCVEVDGLLDEAQAEHVGVEVDVPLRVAGDHRDVVQPCELHRFLPRRRPQRLRAPEIIVEATNVGALRCIPVNRSCRRFLRPRVPGCYGPRREMEMIKRMLLREVEYARPGSIEEAVRLLGAHDGARALAGGQTLVNVMKARAASPEVLVDLADLAELRTIGRSADGVARARRDGHLQRAGPLARGRGGPAAPRRGRCARSPTARCRTAAPSAATSASTTRRTTCRRCSAAMGATFTILGPERRAHRPGRRLLPRRLHDRRRRGRAAHARDRARSRARERRRDGGRHARRARHLHRERRRDGRRRAACASRSAASRACPSARRRSRSACAVRS